MERKLREAMYAMNRAIQDYEEDGPGDPFVHQNMLDARTNWWMAMEMLGFDPDA